MRVYFSGARLPGKCRANPEDLLSVRRPHVMLSFFTIGAGGITLAANSVTAAPASQGVFKKRLIGYLKK